MSSMGMSQTLTGECRLWTPQLGALTTSAGCTLVLSLLHTQPSPGLWCGVLHVVCMLTQPHRRLCMQGVRPCNDQGGQPSAATTHQVGQLAMPAGGGVGARPGQSPAPAELRHCWHRVLCRPQGGRGPPFQVMPGCCNASTCLPGSASTCGHAQGPSSTPLNGTVSTLGPQGQALAIPDTPGHVHCVDCQTGPACVSPLC